MSFTRSAAQAILITIISMLMHTNDCIKASDTAPNGEVGKSEWSTAEIVAINEGDYKINTKQFLSEIEKNSSLFSLTLNTHCLPNTINPDDFVIKTLKKCHSLLKEFKLLPRFNALIDDLSPNLYDSLLQFFHLTSLELRHCNLTPTNAPLLEKCIVGFTGLTLLNLENNNLQLEGFNVLSKAIAYHPAITSLALQSNNIHIEKSSSDTPVFVTNLSSNTSLTHLDLSTNHLLENPYLESNLIPCVSEIIKNNPNIKSMALERMNYNISIEEFIDLIDALMTQGTCESLNVSANCIDHLFTEKLLTIVRKMGLALPHLKALRLPLRDREFMESLLQDSEQYNNDVINALKEHLALTKLTTELLPSNCRHPFLARNKQRHMTLQGFCLKPCHPDESCEETQALESNS